MNKHETQDFSVVADVVSKGDYKLGNSEFASCQRSREVRRIIDEIFKVGRKSSDKTLSRKKMEVKSKTTTWSNRRILTDYSKKLKSHNKILWTNR